MYVCIYIYIYTHVLYTHKIPYHNVTQHNAACHTIPYHAGGVPCARGAALGGPLQHSQLFAIGWWTAAVFLIKIPEMSIESLNESSGARCRWTGRQNVADLYFNVETEVPNSLQALWLLISTLK